MPINITDELHAATTKGKIASAKEVFLTGDKENLQQIGEKTHQLEDSIKNIAATGGASTAAAVTFDNAASGMTAVNAQAAIDEVSSISHFAKRGSAINISTNYNSTNTAEILTLSQAINKIPSKDRVLGFQGKYLASDGWHTIIYTGDSLSTWENSTKWVDFTDSIFNSISKNATFAGIATPSTNPGSHDGPVFYFATSVGTYSNFDGIVLDTPGLAIFYSNSANGWDSLKIYDFLDGRSSTEIGAYEYNGTSNYVKIPIKQDTLVKEGYMFYVVSTNTSQVALFSENDANRLNIVPNTWTKVTFKPSYINTLVNTDFKIIFCSPEIFKLWSNFDLSFEINTIDIDSFLKNPDNWVISDGRATTKKNIPIFIIKKGIQYVDSPEKKLRNIIFTVYDKSGAKLGKPYYTYNEFKREAGASTVKVQIPGYDNATDNITSVEILTSILNSIKTFGLYSYSVIDDEGVTTNKIADEAVTTNKIADEAVTIKKMPSIMWLSSDNLWNEFTASRGVYLLTTNGTLSTNPIYDTSDFIKVSGNTLYSFGNNGKQSKARFVCEYDVNKKYLSNSNSETNTYLTSKTCAFIRVTFLASYSNKQVCKDTLSSYEPANYINPLFLPNTKVDVNVDKRPIYFHLPAHIYVPAGLTVEMYYKQMLLDADDFYISATGIGLNLKRKLQIIGDNNRIGTYDLSVKCYNKKEEIVASAISKVHVVSSTIPKVTKVLPIGDSITNSKPWLTRLSTLSSNISTVGTRGGKHEGRSGGTCKFYNTGDSSYSFDVNYTGAGSDAADFNSEKQYHIGDYCKYTVSLNVSNTQKDVKCVFMFTSEHIGEWDESKVVNMTTRNPFWNPFTNKFSINWYKQIQKIDFDIICIWLGTNGITLTPETNENGALGIKTLVDNIRKEDTTTPIIIVNTLFRCSQNGIGKQSNTDGYSPSSEYKHNADKKVLLLENAVDKLLSSYENLYICPVASTFDSEYNFLNPETGKVQVNPYFTNTDVVFELMESDSVHPLNYSQAADQIFGTISSITNNR